MCPQRGTSKPRVPPVTEIISDDEYNCLAATSGAWWRKNGFLGCLESYGVLAKKAMPYAIKSIYNESEGVQVSAIWLLRAFKHHSIRAVPKLLALSLAKPREYPGQEAYEASVSIIRSWISYVLHRADLGELKAQKPNPNMANFLLRMSQVSVNFTMNISGSPRRPCGKCWLSARENRA